MKKIALIGLGGISQSVHLPLLTRNDGRFAVVALVDLSAQRCAQVAQRVSGPIPQQFTSVDQLVDAVAQGLEIDGAILATTGSHGRDVGKLLRAGIKVLAEKPLALTLAEHEELAALATELNIDPAQWLRVGYMKEHDPALQQARMLLQGKKIRSVQVEVLHPADGAQLEFAQLLAPPQDVQPQEIESLNAATNQLVEQAIGAQEEELHKLYTNVILGSIIHDISALRVLVGGIGNVTRAHHWGDSFPGSLSLGGHLKEHSAPWAMDWHFIADYPEYQETLIIHHEQGTVKVTFSVPYILNAPTKLEITETGDTQAVNRSIQTWPQQEAFERQLWAFEELLYGRSSFGSSIPQSVQDIHVAQQMFAQLATSKGTKVSQRTEVVARNQAVY